MFITIAVIFLLIIQVIEFSILFIKPKKDKSDSLFNLPIRIFNINPSGCPQYATTGSAGFDLYANVTGTIEPGEQMLVPTGIKVAIPKGFEMQVRGRSGLAAKSMIGVTNAPGTIDSDYRGEVHVILINHGKSAFGFTKGDRIGQGVIAPVCTAIWKVVENEDGLGDTNRGSGGFGHTGK